MSQTRAISAASTAGYIMIAVLSFIGVAGATVHLLDGTVQLGDTPDFRQTTEQLYGPDFAPHWYGFRTRPIARALHMAPGLFWMAFAPLQFVGSLRRRFPRFHRWVGRIAIGSTLVLIPSGLIFAALRPLSNAFVELVPVIFYSILYVAATFMGVRRAREKNFAAHREWMVRSFAVGIGISSVRLWYLLFLHTTGMHAQEFFATAFWIAFAVNLVIAEIWINVTRRTAAVGVTRPLSQAAPGAADRVSALDWVAREARP